MDPSVQPAREAGGSLPRRDSSAADALRRALDDASNRLNSILEEAEREAQEIRVEASEYAESRKREADARAEAKKIELEDHLASVRARIRRLATDTEELAGELAGILERSENDDRRVTAAAEPVRAGAAAPTKIASREGGGEKAGDQERALLLATQMAVAGIGLQEIEAALHRDIGIEDPSALIDRVMGRG